LQLQSQKLEFILSKLSIIFQIWALKCGISRFFFQNLQVIFQIFFEIFSKKTEKGGVFSLKFGIFQKRPLKKSENFLNFFEKNREGGGLLSQISNFSNFMYFVRAVVWNPALPEQFDRNNKLLARRFYSMRAGFPVEIGTFEN
jgi:hypothetical protein